MQIERNKVVQFRYRLTSQGRELDASGAGEAAAYLHGAGNIIAGLERAMTGRRPGDRFEISIPPEEAYGRRDPQGMRRVPLKHVGDRRKLRPGQRIRFDTRSGPVLATIVKVGRFNVDVDSNHPLAGLTLDFEVEIVDVRDATEEELAHGHAHGPGGHQHD